MDTVVTVVTALAQLFAGAYTPSPRLTRFHVARNSTSAEFLKTALCGIPLQWNSSKSRYAEFQWNSKYSPTNAIFA